MVHNEILLTTLSNTCVPIPKVNNNKGIKYQYLTRKRREECLTSLTRLRGLLELKSL